MGYNIFLDDLRNPRDTFNYTKNTIYNKLNWIVVRSYDEFKKLIESNPDVDIISFDHDLSYEHYDILGKTDFLTWDEYYSSSDREMTGYDCAKWVCDFYLKNKIKFPKILIHSMNTIGSENISSYIRNFKKYNDIE